MLHIKFGAGAVGAGIGAASMTRLRLRHIAFCKRNRTLRRLHSAYYRLSKFVFCFCDLLSISHLFTQLFFSLWYITIFYSSRLSV
jgi:hypothetical protein